MYSPIYSSYVYVGSVRFAVICGSNTKWDRAYQECAVLFDSYMYGGTI